MDEYSQFSKNELEELLLFTLNLDKEIVANYFTPRWQKHNENLIEIYRQVEVTQSKKELAVALALLVTEPVVRSHMKDVLSTTANNSSIAEKLLPFHRDVEELLEQLRKEVFSYTDPLKSIVSQEKESIQELLEELTKMIRLHAQDGDRVLESQINPQHSPLTAAVAQARDAIPEKEAQKSQNKKILVTVLPSYLERVLGALSPHVDSDQMQELENLLTKGSSTVPIYFNESRVMLGDFYRRLKDKGILQGVKHYTDLAKWLSQHYFFWSKDEGKLMPVNEKSILKVLRQGDYPDSRIQI
ncbi:hypothetical protein D770_11340 [Flammeovirgaceae bacterium 311]|nr:hypothetical protein D770_11340 [Flammeovirgaceae bacterium 311]